MSIFPGDILMFVRVRLRFEKSSPRWEIVGREEIEKIEEGSTEIGRQRERTTHCNRPRQVPVDRMVDLVHVGRPRLTCTVKERSTGPGRPTETRLLSVGAGRPDRSTGHRSTDKRVLAVLSRFGFLFCLGSNPIGVS